MAHHASSALGPITSAKLPKLEPEPDLSDDVILRTTAGLRPFRAGGFRIEFETIRNKSIIHNYGHGGAGVTMCWGSAAEVARLATRNAAHAKSVCVIGAGVIGLTTALVLREAGLQVRVCSESFTPNTTSDVAGAQWAPTLVDVGMNPESQQVFDRILRASFAKFSSLLGPTYGVSVRPNYLGPDHETGFLDIPAGVLPPMQFLDELPFQGHRSGGRVCTTYLIEPPVFMPRLMEDCRASGISMETKRLGSANQILQLPEDLIVNCTGCGAAQLMNDLNVIPVRGQLVHLKPQRLPWLLSHDNGYVFPRQDAVVLGGTKEFGIREATTTSEGIALILRQNREFFDGP